MWDEGHSTDDYADTTGADDVLIHEAPWSSSSPATPEKEPLCPP